MQDPYDELGTVQALLKRLNRWRIPSLLATKERLESGDTLSDLEIEQLERTIDDAEEAAPYLLDHPELQELAAKMVDLYHDISELALRNEERSLPQLKRPSKE